MYVCSGNVPNPSVARGTSVLSCYTGAWNSPIDSISATSFAKAGQGTPTSRSYYQASGSHDAENFGSFLPHRDNFAGGMMVCRSNSGLSQLNAFEGGDRLPVNSLPLTDESINELEPDSKSRLRYDLEHNYEITKDSSSPIEAVKTSSPNQESLSPTHTNIQERRSNLSPG